MKKKTKFRLKNDLALPFSIAIFLCLLGASTSFLLFYNSFFRALSKLNEAPIATITFKYKTAQRKFIDRVVWDRLRQNSPVYNGDTIHTADLSEATVWFDDGTMLDLAENTMAQVFRHDDGTLAANVGSGSASVDTAQDSSGLTLTAANVTVAVQAGSRISAQAVPVSADGSTLEQAVTFNVQKGEVALEDGKTLQAGDVVAVTDSGINDTLLTVTSPAPLQKILYHNEDSFLTHFAWTNAPQNLPLTLTIAHDKDFTQIDQSVSVTDLSEVDLALSKGTWYWRLEATDAASAERTKKAASKNAPSLTQTCTGKLQLIQALRPDLLAPANDYNYDYRTKTPAVRFIWTESEAATAYQFVAAHTPDFANPVIEARTSSPSLIISTLSAGTYYWRVTPYYTVNRTGFTNESETAHFVIEKRGELTAPVLMVPIAGDLVDKASGKGMTFSWRVENEATRYRFVIASDQNMAHPVLQKEVSENYCNLSDKAAAAFSDGQYFWTVTQIDSEGNESAPSAVRSFYTLSGSVELRSVFPPNDYTLWQPLLGDTRFT